MNKRDLTIVSRPKDPVRSRTITLSGDDALVAAARKHLPALDNLQSPVGRRQNELFMIPEEAVTIYTTN